MELLPDPWHGEEDRRPARLEVVGHRGQALGEPGLAPGDDLAEVADHALGDVAERQVAEETVLGDEADHGFERVDRPLEVAVGQHGAFGWAGGAAGVHEGRVVAGSDAVGATFDDVGFRLEPGGAVAAQAVQVDQHVVAVEAGERRQPDDDLEVG